MGVDNIKMDLKCIGCEDVSCINVTLGREKWRAVVNIRSTECGNVLPPERPSAL
jgi:hypothetical protein